MTPNAEALAPPTVGRPDARSLSPAARRLFVAWTAFFWGGVGVCGFLFYLGVLDFRDSTRIALYGISIWLNGWLLAFLARRSLARSTLDLYHDALVLWMLSYALTNLLWEVPWVIFSRVVFVDLHTMDDVLAATPWMRESLANMYWWVLASFSSVDLRTVNHDSTFFTVEIFAFANLATTAWFFHLNRKRSPYRYLIAVIGCGEPIAATFIFTFAEVFGGFVNMPGGVADTLLALVWTQYQYFFFPMLFGALGYRLLLADWRRCYVGAAGAAGAIGDGAGAREDDEAEGEPAPSFAARAQAQSRAPHRFTPTPTR